MNHIALSDVAADWWVPPSHVLTWVGNGTIPTPRVVDGRVVWDQSVLDAWELAGYPRSPKPGGEALNALLQAAS